MQERLIQLHTPIASVLSDKKVSKRDDLQLDMTASPWALAEDLVKALEPFQVGTTVLSAEYNVSLSCVMPIMFKLVKAVKDSVDDSPAIARFKATARAQLQSRFHLQDIDAESLANIASALDPRFKKLTFLRESDAFAVRLEDWWPHSSVLRTTSTRFWTST